MVLLEGRYREGYQIGVRINCSVGVEELVACFARCIFAPESAIARMFLLGVLGGALIHFI